MIAVILAEGAGLLGHGGVWVPSFTVPTIAEEVILGLYIGVLTGIFPALVAFVFGFGFKYFTNVTVPGFGVVVLGGALAGISGGLLGVLNPEIAGSWTGVTAVIVILMASLWAHGIGDTLGAKTPRRLTLQRIKEAGLSADLVERVDSFGQIRVHPVGDIHDIPGYPPLPDDVHEAIRTGSWKFPATLSLPEIERQLETKLLETFDLTEVSVQVDRRGRAQIAAAPTVAGLSRRLPPGKRAVTIKTLLPTGVGREDVASIDLADGRVTGPIMSAWTETADHEEARPEPPSPRDPSIPDAGAPEQVIPAPPPKAPRTTGGEGNITIAVGANDARRVIRQEFAPVVVHSRGKQREYEAVALLADHGNRFRKLTIAPESALVGQTVADARLEDEYGVVILTIQRGVELLVNPAGETTLTAGDVAIVTGMPDALDALAEAVG